jgi:hypothetical protein
MPSLGQVRFAPKADIDQRAEHVRLVPKAVVSNRSEARQPLFNHLVGKRKQIGGDFDAEHLGSL